MSMENASDKEVVTARSKALPGLPVLPQRNGLIELAVFFTIIIALEFGLNSFPDLNELEPHPFWLPVLLLSLQYGTVSGLMAAAVSILFSAFMGWPEQDIGENHFNYLIRIWAEPVLWIAVALLLGQFRMRQISERRTLHRTVQELQSQRTAIAAHSENLRNRCDSLERQISGRRDASGKTVLDAYALLGTTDPRSLRSGFGSALLALLGPGQYSLFALHDDTLILAASQGWQTDAPWRRSFSIEEPMARRLLGEMQGLTVFNETDEHDLDGQGYAAVPVCSVKSNRVLGFLKVEEMQPERFGHETLQHLHLIAAQLAASLELLDGDEFVSTGEEPTAVSRSRTRSWRKTHWVPRTASPRREDNPAAVLKKPKIGR